MMRLAGSSEADKRSMPLGLRRGAAVLLLAAALLLSGGCAFMRTRLVAVEEGFYLPPVPERPAPPKEVASPFFREQIVPPREEVEEEEAPPPPFRQRGLASWYGAEQHGTRTASGERFNKADYTAAHRTLPFGTRVMVRNLENQQAVVVRITDRGPFVRNRIIDLSEAAARRIGIFHPGTARVEIEVLQ